MFRLVLLVCALFTCFLARQHCLTASVGAPIETGSRLPRAADVKLVSLGYDQLLADLYWLKFISYEGDSRARLLDGYASASAYLELITGLDPRFTEAYWFASFSVGADQKRPDLADAILQTGIERNPDNWYLPYIAGLNAYLNWHDEAKAAKYYRMAARFPEAPRWLAGQAKILESGIPSIVKKIRTWDAIYRSNEPEKVRNRAKEQLIALWVAVFNSNAGKQIKERARQALIDLDYQVN